MNNPDQSQFLGTAFRAAMLAGDYIIKSLGNISKSDIDIKQTSDFVTIVDRESENIIINTIKSVFPDHHFLAEESADKSTTGQYRWIIDPLDGTTNFIHQYPFFSVSIALEYEGEVTLGLVYDPLREEIYTAQKECGAYLNGTSFRVSSTTELSGCLISTGFPFRKKEIIDDYLKLFKNILYKVSDIRRAGSAAIDLAHIACGRCDGFFEVGLSPWDIAAGSLIIREAGGVVTDFSGGGDYLLTGNIVAGTPIIHPILLDEVKSVFQDTISK
jgi:myo-inositol-1(or 4)-monophosphatase